MIFKNIYIAFFLCISLTSASIAQPTSKEYFIYEKFKGYLSPLKESALEIQSDEEFLLNLKTTKARHNLINAQALLKVHGAILPPDHQILFRVKILKKQISNWLDLSKKHEWFSKYKFGPDFLNHLQSLTKTEKNKITENTFKSIRKTFIDEVQEIFAELESVRWPSYEIHQRMTYQFMADYLQDIQTKTWDFQQTEEGLHKARKALRWFLKLAMIHNELFFTETQSCSHDLRFELSHRYLDMEGHKNQSCFIDYCALKQLTYVESKLGNFKDQTEYFERLLSYREEMGVQDAKEVSISEFQDKKICLYDPEVATQLYNKLSSWKSFSKLESQIRVCLK